MKISFIKYKQNQDSYKLPKALGMDIYEIKNPEEIDKKIEQLKEKEYKTVFIPNDLASFSEDLVSKYKNDTNFNIIITPTQED